MNKFFLLLPFLALHINLSASQKIQHKNFGKIELPTISSDVIKMVKNNKDMVEMYAAILANGDQIITRHYLAGLMKGFTICEHHLVDLHGQLIDMPPYSLDSKYYFLLKKMYETAE